MPAFAKNPKFIAGVIFVLWLAYVVYENSHPAPYPIRLFPGVSLDLGMSVVMMSAAIFGAAVTLVIQFLWRRRSSKNGSSSAAASNKTVA
ncbi:MAG TPA: hypothetical protein VEC38_00680 [Candidatus Binataceae bacterium]|nr:hypothetical protein [Candidatus Binataceae bacterium]